MFLKSFKNVFMQYVLRLPQVTLNRPPYFDANKNTKLHNKFHSFTSFCYKQYGDSNRKVRNLIVNDNYCNQSKFKIISQLNLKCDEDALPFYKLPIRSLIQIYKTTKSDEELKNCKNRLYYLSDRLKYNPSNLSGLIARRPFIYSLSFDWLKSSLDTLLDMGVSEDRIVRDLWVLKYHCKTIEERLVTVKNMGVDNIYPWMVRCSERILNRSICISQETKTILGDIKSTKNYLANRLNTTPEAVEEMYFTIPALKRIRASKVKKFLDFLIEEGFEVNDIAKKPRVLSASQKTVMLRLDKLRKLGLREINLNVLCRSRKDFQKYCESIESALNIKEP